MYCLAIVTGVAVCVSLVANPKKTLEAVRIAARRFAHVAPPFLAMLILVSVALYLVPDRVISEQLGASNKALSVLIASLLGSITVMPGFIAFPLCGILANKGVLYMVLAAFSTTLMMVGILTYPLEKTYFGARLTIARNAISLCVALIVTLAIGVMFGELS